MGPTVLKHGVELYWTDWAVGRLARPVAGVRPFMPGNLNLQHDGEVMVISQGMNDAITRICAGRIDQVERMRNVLSFTSTCDTGPGASGGPVIATSPEDARRGVRPVIGLTLGWVDDGAKNVRHFALPIEVEVMTAVVQTLNRSSPV